MQHFGTGAENTPSHVKSGGNALQSLSCGHEGSRPIRKVACATYGRRAAPSLCDMCEHAFINKMESFISTQGH